MIPIFPLNNCCAVILYTRSYAAISQLPCLRKQTTNVWEIDVQINFKFYTQLASETMLLVGICI